MTVPRMTVSGNVPKGVPTQYERLAAALIAVGSGFVVAGIVGGWMVMETVRAAGRRRGA